MMQATAFRGQPLLVLSALLVGWVAARASLWQPPFAAPETAVSAVRTARSALRIAGGQRSPAVPEEFALAVHRTPLRALASTPIAMTSHNSLPLQELEQSTPLIAIESISRRKSITGPSLPAATSQKRMSASPVLIGPAAPQAAPLPVAAPAQGPRPTSRWSGDAWVLLRQGGGRAILTSRPSYGRSQAGGVIRYGLSEAPLRAQVYLRASAALSGAPEREAAAGISARPMPGFPVRLAVEARVSETSGRTSVRAATYAVTELPPIRLPLDVQAEVYAQAGYVDGEFATAFADGQARLDRVVFRSGNAAMNAGVGMWGGIQDGASRLDVGPAAAVSFELGDARGRVEAGYRFRVAGAAAPPSGPALTISASF